MVVQAEEMARAVRVAIDMNRGDEPLIMEGDCETLTLDEIIYAKLADGVRMVEMEAPVRMLDGGHDLFERLGGDDVFVGDDGKGFVVLPDDFMRLLCFRMSDWKRTVFEAITESDPRYGLQSSRFKGICGNREKPVVAIVRRSEGKVLEFYSSEGRDAEVVQAMYLPYPRVDAQGGIEISEACYQAAIYRAASLVLASVGDQLSGAMLEMSRGLLS